MKMKSVTITLLAIGILSLVTLTPAHAALPGLSVYARTDRVSYAPGDTGTLFITVRNQGSSAFTIKNVSVTYPWKFFITDHWDGNLTTTGITQALATGQTYNTQYTFTVPTDGRLTGIFGGTISISIGTAEPSSSGGTTTDGSATIMYTVATYQPISLTSSVLPIIQIVLLGIAVVMLALVYMGIGKLSKK
jgi:hypothetical protein